MGGQEVRTTLWRLPAMRALAAVSALGFASYGLTLASLPTYAVQGGASTATVGLVTVVFLGMAIVAQVTVPVLTTRFGHTRVLIAGLLALGLPSPLYPIDDGLVFVCALSGVRGVGFAVMTVLGSTLAAQVTPAARRGEAIGVHGLAIAVPSLVAVPTGVALVLDGHIEWLAALASMPVLGVVFVPTLTRAIAVSVVQVASRSGGSAMRAALPPSLVLFTVALAAGGVVTFIPIERPDGATAAVALLLFGIARALSRWRAGLLADRFGGRWLLPISVLVTAVGMMTIAGGLVGGSFWLLTGAALFGSGFGAVQNLTLVAAFARAGSGGITTASAMWNASLDAGTAAGALLLGLLAVDLGLSWAFLLSALLLVLILPLGRLSASTGRQPTT